MHTRQVTMSFRFADETDKLVSCVQVQRKSLLITDEKLSKVLDARRDEVLLQTNAAMQANLEMLKRIAFIAGEENQKPSKISSNTLKDSRALKSLTTIATMYLPASLIAVSIANDDTNKAAADVDTRQSSAQVLCGFGHQLRTIILAEALRWPQNSGFTL